MRRAAQSAPSDDRYRPSWRNVLMPPDARLIESASPSGRSPAPPCARRACGTGTSPPCPSGRRADRCRRAGRRCWRRCSGAGGEDERRRRLARVAAILWWCSGAGRFRWRRCGSGARSGFSVERAWLRVPDSRWRDVGYRVRLVSRGCRGLHGDRPGGATRRARRTRRPRVRDSPAIRPGDGATSSARTEVWWTNGRWYDNSPAVS